MPKQFLSFFLLLLITAMGCQKDDVQLTNTSNESSSETLQSLSDAKGVVSTNHWYGFYANKTPLDTSSQFPGDDPDISDVYDFDMIHDGVAKLPTIGGWLFFSTISFDIPAQYSLPGDSILFEAVVKNPKDGIQTDWDVCLQITGDQHSADVHFVADSAYQAYTHYGVGSKNVSNNKALVHYFSAFETVKLATQKGQTGVYINNKLVYNFKYNVANRIGKIKTITISGKGYITVDNVKLTNSITKKKLMQETFNTDGESHTVFY